MGTLLSEMDKEKKNAPGPLLASKYLFHVILLIKHSVLAGDFFF